MLTFFLQRPVFSIVLFLLIILFGFLSMIQLPLREYPDIEKSQITIDTRYSGSASAIIETKITEVIENQISGIEGIKSISSVSRDGRSKINIEFDLGKDINEAFAASLISFPRSNSIFIFDLPSRLTDEIDLIPSIPLI